MKKKKKIIIIISIVILIILIIILYFIVFYKSKKEEVIYNNNQETKSIKQDKVVDLINTYISNNQNIFDYAKDNNLNQLSLLDLNENLKIDISEFKELSYNCNAEETFINFMDDYSNYFIVIACDEFLLDK